MLIECSKCQANVDAQVCPKCSHPMLVYDDDLTEGEFIRLYPPMDRNSHSSVPKPIREAFLEARTCFRVKAFIAAAIMCRKTLEGICSATTRKARTLAGELKELCCTNQPISNE